eukprot:TRINITY_DN1499_c0_g1_i1.p1 TRINITY_DN1499_c0_g1~~TRINITY_DN1499_c0_g1_i1.p1  ORF type:complete len:316 (+),score=35.77 TRINITY_DN1499_c0_g1_i1:629-1576(+)
MGLGSIQVWGCVRSSRHQHQHVPPRPLPPLIIPSSPQDVCPRSTSTISDGENLSVKKLSPPSSRNELYQKRAGDDLRGPIPTPFFDPITQNVMVDPVRTPSGQALDRSTLERHLEHYNTDPFTGLPMRLSDARSLVSLQASIASFLLPSSTNTHSTSVSSSNNKSNVDPLPLKRTWTSDNKTDEEEGLHKRSRGDGEEIINLLEEGTLHQNLAQVLARYQSHDVGSPERSTTELYISDPPRKQFKCYGCSSTESVGWVVLPSCKHRFCRGCLRSSLLSHRQNDELDRDNGERNSVYRCRCGTPFQLQGVAVSHCS